MYCIKCGTRLSDDSLFCHACGAKVVREIPPKGQEKMEAPVNTPPEPVNNSTKSNTEEVQEEKKSGWKNWLLNGFLIIFFLIASAIGKQLGRLWVLYFHFTILFRTFCIYGRINDHNTFFCRN